ncbi:hypothetical protein E2C01_054821 [Portunus trituberculatus]|uniref:Uncharacterized protein n=1 Tax=Portunus trituberculatus TaxID=210409 RepID=A0A5B7GTP7_PORTR|nr:hypothetical protein [Portunus trituberculatus]
MAEKPELLGETLTRHYRLSCELLGSYPVPHFTHQLSRGSLDLHLDTVDLDHLEVLCHTLKNKVSPSSLRISVPKANEGVLSVCVCQYIRLRDSILELNLFQMAVRVLKV